jgi:hypothetical protein
MERRPAAHLHAHFGTNSATVALLALAFFSCSVPARRAAAPLASGMAAMLWAVSDGCEATAQQVRQFRPADQRAETWVAALVNRFESDAQGLGDLPGRWEAGEGVCGAHLTVAALLRGGAP